MAKQKGKTKAKLSKEKASSVAKGIQAKRHGARAEKHDPELDAFIDQVLATLELGFIAGLGDGQLTDDEFQDLLHNLKIWLNNDELTEDDLKFYLDGFMEAINAEGVDARVREVAKSLTTPEAKESAFRFAALIAGSSGEIGDDELETLSKIGDALGIDEAAAQKLVDDELAGLEAGGA